MEVMDPQRRGIVAAIQQHNNQLFQVQQLLQRWRRRRRRNQRAIHVRDWIGRRLDLGMYNKLMVELRNEDPRAFHNFMRMPPAMFDELVDRLTPRLTKKQINFRPNLEPGLKVALTMRHLSSGTKYREMQYAWRVPRNTISKVVREVCKAIQEEYLDEQMTCPTTEEEWRRIADDWLQNWNFPHTVGAIDGKHLACKVPPTQDRNNTITRISLV